MMIEGPFADVRAQLVAYFDRRIAAGEFRNTDPKKMTEHSVGAFKADNHLVLFQDRRRSV
jgi:hypothetical protein